MNRKSLIILFILVTAFTKAEIKLPAIFSDNMLLQQDTQVNIWGKAVPDKTVTIKTSWSKKTIKIGLS